MSIIKATRANLQCNLNEYGKKIVVDSQSQSEYVGGATTWRPCRCTRWDSPPRGRAENLYPSQRQWKHTSQKTKFIFSKLKNDKKSTSVENSSNGHIFIKKRAKNEHLFTVLGSSFFSPVTLPTTQLHLAPPLPPSLITWKKKNVKDRDSLLLNIRIIN